MGKIINLVEAIEKMEIGTYVEYFPINNERLMVVTAEESGWDADQKFALNKNRYAFRYAGIRGNELAFIGEPFVTVKYAEEVSKEKKEEIADRIATLFESPEYGIKARQLRDEDADVESTFILREMGDVPDGTVVPMILVTVGEKNIIVVEDVARSGRSAEMAKKMLLLERDLQERVTEIRKQMGSLTEQLLKLAEELAVIEKKL